MLRDTQLESWQRIAKHLGRKQRDVYDVIQSRQGASSQDIADCLHLPLHSISGRITELCRMGRIEDSGKRYVNMKSGRNQIVWVAIEDGIRDAGRMSMTSVDARKIVGVDATIV